MKDDQKVISLVNLLSQNVTYLNSSLTSEIQLLKNQHDQDFVRKNLDLVHTIINFRFTFLSNIFLIITCIILKILHFVAENFYKIKRILESKY